MNQVEQSVTEYVDEVWEDVVADIEQLVSYPSVAVAADAEPGAPFGRPVRDALDCALGIAQKLGYQTSDDEALWESPIFRAAAISSSRPSAMWTWYPLAPVGTPTRLRWSAARAGCSAVA